MKQSVRNPMKSISTIFRYFDYWRSWCKTIHRAVPPEYWKDMQPCISTPGEKVPHFGKFRQYRGCCTVRGRGGSCHLLLYSLQPHRHSHTSWVTGEGLLLVAGSGSPKTSPPSTSLTSEFVNGAINFTLPQKYR